MILLSSKVNIVIITKTYYITKSNNNSNNNKNKNKWTYHRQKDILTFLIHLACFNIFKKHI